MTDFARHSDGLTRLRAKALYLQAPTSNITIFAIAVLYYFLLRGRTDADLLFAWALLMCAVASVRLLLWFLHRRDEYARSPQFWLRSYTVASVLVGFSWGAIQPLVSDLTDIVLLTAILMLVFGVLSSAVSFLAVHLPAFFGYALPQVGLLGLTLIKGGPSFAGLSLALFLYMVMLTIFAINAYRSFVQSQLLILENQDLVQQLNHENNRREDVIQARTTSLKETNAELEREIGERELAEEALRKQQSSLKRMAHHDALTGLPNRLLLTDRLSQSIMRADRHPALHAVIFMDLDHFKQINDSLGHSAGDDLLKAVAKRLLECVRKEDTVARLGGDEFILLIERLSDIEAVSHLADKILHAFAEPFNLGGRLFSLGVSMGVGLYPDDGKDPETLLRNADAAMYRAKEEGRNAYRFYSAEMTEEAHNRVILGVELNEALENGQLELYYQPLFALASGALLGAEALLRWNHPVDGVVLPEAFISVAEESVLINRIGFWVLREGCRQLRTWQDAGFSDLRLSINLSGREVWNNPLLENVDEVLRDTGCSAHMLELEITESFLVQQPKQARRLMQELRVRGISVTVDDFGKGYSSLSYLKEYPISKLKIDKAFVRDIQTDEDDQSIVRAIIALGHSLDLTIIGEGVETEVQAEFLRQEGCDQVQGYLYARPMPASDFENYLQSLADPLSADGSA